MSEKSKQEATKFLQREKLKVGFYPLIIATFLYGVQLSIFPQILDTYSVYALVSDFVPHWEVGSVFILLSLIMLVAFKANWRNTLFIASIVLLMVWSMFTVAFVFSPPPNTIWIFAALMTFLTFQLTRRV